MKAVLDTLRNAEGQLDAMNLGLNGEPDEAQDFRHQVQASLGTTLDLTEAWHSFEMERLS